MVAVAEAVARIRLAKDVVVLREGLRCALGLVCASDGRCARPCGRGPSCGRVSALLPPLRRPRRSCRTARWTACARSSPGRRPRSSGRTPGPPRARERPTSARPGQLAPPLGKACAPTRVRARPQVVIAVHLVVNEAHVSDGVAIALDPESAPRTSAIHGRLVARPGGRLLYGQAETLLPASPSRSSSVSSTATIRMPEVMASP